ncbi:MAG: AAA family ATPase, partial [Delftia sp.]|nr:AAA family ATPase [Delftia sp.]
MYDVVIGVGFGMPYSVMEGVAFGLVVGVMFGMAEGVALGVAAGVAGGVAYGLVFGVAFGVALGVFFIFGVLRVYFWLPELFWLWLLKLLPLRPAARLSVLPPYFDQLSYLPLPFIPTFIAEAYQENQAAARRTIDYLITSTNQQKAARQAMSKIAAEECSRCQSAGDIAAIRYQLNWIPDQQADGLAGCLEISQDVNAALEGSSPYRKGQQIDKVLRKIDRQRNALATASAREATAFGTVLDQWQRILETARNILREQAAESNEIPQPYLAGPALDPDKAGPLFKGRRDLFRQIETLTLSAQHPT